MNSKRNPRKTRELILEAAFHEFHRHGFQAASLKRILAYTGVTKGALYRHFSNKRALGYAVVEEVLENVVEQDWIRPLETAQNPINRVVFSGPDDPNYAVCKITPYRVEYWSLDPPGGPPEVWEA